VTTLPPSGPLHPGPGAHAPVVDTSATLPRTGADGLGATVAGGLVLVALGVAIVAGARRRHDGGATDPPIGSTP
jgi:LPXTG-motif cell wall-anchored protein